MAMGFDALYEYIQRYEAERGYCPTQGEIAAYMGISQAYVCRLLHEMEAAGLLLINRRHRGIELKAGEKEQGGEDEIDTERSRGNRRGC